MREYIINHLVDFPPLGFSIIFINEFCVFFESHRWLFYWHHIRRILNFLRFINWWYLTRCFMRRFLTLVKYVLEVVFFICAELMEDIIAVRLSLSSWSFNNATQSTVFNFGCPTKLHASFLSLMYNLLLQ